MAGVFVAGWQLLKINEEVNRHPGFGRDDPIYHENENTFESEHLKPTGEMTSEDFGVDHAYADLQDIFDAGIQEPTSAEQMEMFAHSLGQHKIDEMAVPEIANLMNNEIEARKKLGPQANYEELQGPPREAPPLPEGILSDEGKQNAARFGYDKISQMLGRPGRFAEEPSFKNLPFNEETDFTTGEPMDLAFRLLKAHYRDTDETRHGEGAMREVTIPHSKKKML